MAYQWESGLAGPVGLSYQMLEAKSGGRKKEENTCGASGNDFSNDLDRTTNP